MGDFPANNHFYERYSTDFTVIDYYDTCGYYHTVIDVNFDNVVLSPGRYWVQFTPVGCDGDWHFQARTYQHYGADLAHRDGDPTGGYSGDYGSYTWIHFVTGFDMCFKLTGHVGDPPTPPIIDGPPTGKKGEKLCWTFKSDDPDGDMVCHTIDWGDGTPLHTTLHGLPNTPIEECHIYTGTGSFQILAFAVDENGVESTVSSFNVQVTKKAKSLNSHMILFDWLFEQFPNAFPILRLLLQR
jgi:hypothetical protein